MKKEIRDNQAIYENPLNFEQVYRRLVPTSPERHFLDPAYGSNVVLPTWDHGGDPNLTRGLYWLRQLHIFECPFYYIDYSLASFCALQFYSMMKKDRAGAWESYLALSRKGCSIPFRQLLKESGLKDPFGPDALRELAEVIREELGL